MSSNPVRRASYHADTVLYKVDSTYYDHNRSTGVLSSSTDAQSLIQSALNRGGHAHWAAGTYSVTQMINPTVSNLAVTCEPGTVLQTSGNITALKFGNGVYQGGAATPYENVTIDGLTINCNTAVGSDVYGLWFHTVDDFKVRNCTIYNQGTSAVRAAGIAMDNCIGGTVDSNHLFDVTNGIVPRNGCKSFTISNNHVHDTNNYDGIATFQSDGYHAIVGNTVHHCADNGILIDGGALGRNSHTVVSGNTSYANTNEGIETFSSYFTVITGNTSSGNGRRGIAATSVGDNSFTISGNSSYGNTGDGIYCFESRYGLVSGNNVRENGQHGINLDQSNNYVTVTGNNVYLSQQNGIRINRTSYANIGANSLNDNGQATTNTYDDILLTDNGSTFSTNNLVAANLIRAKVTNKTRYGIAENHASDDFNIIINNIIAGTATADINKLGVNSVSTPNY